MSALELYRQTVKAMPPAERLRLASLILQDLSHIEAKVDESGEWTDEDLADLTRASMAHIIQRVEAFS